MTPNGADNQLTLQVAGLNAKRLNASFQAQHTNTPLLLRFLMGLNGCASEKRPYMDIRAAGDQETSREKPYTLTTNETHTRTKTREIKSKLESSIHADRHNWFQFIPENLLTCYGTETSKGSYFTGTEFKVVCLSASTKNKLINQRLNLLASGNHIFAVKVKN